MFRATARLIAMSTVLAFAVTGAAAPVASAGSDERIDVKYGYAQFISDGDVLVAGDIWGDGRGIRARLGWEQDGKFREETVWDDYEGLDSRRSLDIPEGATVLLQLCYTQGGKDTECTRAQEAVA